jgi:hypothetical protein
MIRVHLGWEFCGVCFGMGRLKIRPCTGFFVTTVLKCGNGTAMKADDHFRSVVLLLGLYQLSMKLYKN